MTPASPVVEGLEPIEHQYGKNQPEYEVLPALRSTGRNAIVTSRWEFTAEERKAIADGADVFVSLYTFGSPLQPMFVQVGRKDMPQDQAMSFFVEE